jgi:hypothetical protein
LEVAKALRVFRTSRVLKNSAPTRRFLGILVS